MAGGSENLHSYYGNQCDSSLGDGTWSSYVILGHNPEDASSCNRDTDPVIFTAGPFKYPEIRNNLDASQQRMGKENVVHL